MPMQEYNMSKRLESGWKSVLHDSRTVSAVDPSRYAKRFRTFMKKVFT